MAKKIQDISIAKKAKIDLKQKIPATKLKEKAETLERQKRSVYKKDSGSQRIEDVKGGEKKHYLYVKGEKFSPPPYLGNIIRLAVFGVLIVLFINILSVYYKGKILQKDVVASAQQGYNYLLDAGKNASRIQFDSALNSFDGALENFSQAQDILWFITSDKTFYADEKSAPQSVNALLKGGKYFSVAGGYFLEAMEHFNKIPVYFIAKNKDKTEPTPSLTDALKLGLEKTDLAIEQINLATEELQKVDESTLPTEIALKVQFAKQKVFEVSEMLNSTKQHFPALLKLLGDRYPHRYLILFQNNDELRPTGGFIGSYAIMDLNEGYIEKLEVYDSYDLDGSYGGYIEPPEEFKNLSGNWRFRDSNYSPDFPTSAAKAKWFLEKEGGPSVDTVIGINQGLLKTLLEITGPVQVGNFGKLTANNYNLLLSFVIEGKIWGAQDPKHILKVFVPAFKQALLTEENLGKISSKIFRGIQQSHITMWSPDSEIQALFESSGLDGSMYQNSENEDYLSVININVGGTKSDKFIHETITHHSNIDQYGKIINELTLTRTHTWTDSVYYQWKSILSSYGFDSMPDQIIDILGRGRNKSLVRIYVPKDVVLLDSQGTEVELKYDSDVKKSYFFTTMEVLPGETSEVKIKYQLPYFLDFEPVATYKLIAEKQLGSSGSIFTKTVSFDDQLENIAVYPEESRFNENGDLIFASNLVYDRYFSGVWKK